METNYGSFEHDMQAFFENRLSEEEAYAFLQSVAQDDQLSKQFNAELFLRYGQEEETWSEEGITFMDTADEFAPAAQHLATVKQMLESNTAAIVPIGKTKRVAIVRRIATAAAALLVAAGGLWWYHTGNRQKQAAHPIANTGFRNIKIPGKSPNTVSAKDQNPHKSVTKKDSLEIALKGIATTVSNKKKPVATGHGTIKRKAVIQKLYDSLQQQEYVVGYQDNVEASNHLYALEQQRNQEVIEMSVDFTTKGNNSNTDNAVHYAQFYQAIARMRLHKPGKAAQVLYDIIQNPNTNEELRGAAQWYNGLAWLQMGDPVKAGNYWLACSTQTGNITYQQKAIAALEMLKSKGW
jgi:hypothetical protein